jgi:hypothetical protein
VESRRAGPDLLFLGGIVKMGEITFVFLALQKYPGTS